MQKRLRAGLVIGIPKSPVASVPQTNHNTRRSASSGEDQQAGICLPEAGRGAGRCADSKGGSGPSGTESWVASVII